MIRALRRALFRHKIAPLQSEIARLEAEYEDAKKRHRCRAHITAKIMSKRHQLIRCQTGS